ncbi:MAG TPA: sigma-70 family RNA polymerase sigma factor [Solirubrobacteraceae bacterium]|jgi:RNA polymerase sigma-70 factor (ECF subfamily)|nr:sigma-70 family RNA polymerase sigma factor [Solirubrobacteraceae bacterium]
MNETQLLKAARDGDERAYAALVEAHRGSLYAHCYQMLGSVHDADDAVQEALLKAWRALARFEARSSLRTWLYTIATNVCLRMIDQRPFPRVLPMDYGPPADPHEGLGPPLLESREVEPVPDRELGLAGGVAGPEARYEQREAIELAFVAALQHLPARQRAVLILRDVLGFSGAEVAGVLDTTATSVYSLLQRAHTTIDDRLPDRSQQATLRTLGDQQLRTIVDRYTEAWAHHDVDAIVQMLTESATLAMPPTVTWYRGLEAIEIMFRTVAFAHGRSWRMLPTSANGQLAVGTYERDRSGVYAPHGVTVLTLRGNKIDGITACNGPWMLERFALPPRA